MTIEVSAQVWRERLLNKLRDPKFDFDFITLSGCIVGAAYECGMSILATENDTLIMPAMTSDAVQLTWLDYLKSK